MKYENVTLPLRVSTKGNRISILEAAGGGMRFEAVGGSVIVNGELLRTIDCRSPDRHVDPASVGEEEQIINLSFDLARTKVKKIFVAAKGMGLPFGVDPRDMFESTYAEITPILRRQMEQLAQDGQEVGQ